VSIGNVHPTNGPFIVQAARHDRPNALNALTSDDMKFVEATTGYKITSDRKLAPGVAFELAADRSVGLLTDEVDSTYLRSLVDRYSNSDPTNRPFTSAWIDVALKYADANSVDTARAVDTDA
jgi:hypothetical protein